MHNSSDREKSEEHNFTNMFGSVLNDVAVCNAVALQQQGPGFDFWPTVFLLGIFMFSLCMYEF